MSTSLRRRGLQHTRLPVLHHCLEFAQTQVHWVSDAIQPSYPLSPPSPPALCQALFSLNLPLLTCSELHASLSEDNLHSNTKQKRTLFLHREGVYPQDNRDVWWEEPDSTMWFVSHWEAWFRGRGKEKGKGEKRGRAKGPLKDALSGSLRLAGLFYLFGCAWS